ncbi:sigma-70 family RNA polymerase sigma factor [Carnobacteriaceae bacterium zg-84]|uniref:sigma-70 family RNA polymerase sigma factor n=1 Tax=Granulicatella sp. zg-84 TaxID=2678503 RepID=UPI0013BF66AE|nr:sigma-70 family RNA polymerase sigma factor [Granulicatella sp. zg-84]NEW66072.1 hypothetical protein [Granulicatella sp. zg-84]QMI86602.1 sigma-70 family RNA polymerase sigma factor [Carnobacteriaceae bacterium zg-84]
MENLKKQHYIPMEVNPEEDKRFIKAKGYTLEDVRWWKIGNITKRVILIPCTKEEYDAYMRPIWRELKQEERKKAYFEERGMTQVSVEYVKEAYDLDIIDPSRVEDDIMKKELLSELKAQLEKLSELDQKIMLLFSQGYSESAIGKEVGMSQKGVNKRKTNAIKTLKLHFLEN